LLDKGVGIFEIIHPFTGVELNKANKILEEQLLEMLHKSDSIHLKIGPQKLFNYMKYMKPEVEL
jgi:hypothetical protein